MEAAGARTVSLLRCRNFSLRTNGKARKCRTCCESSCPIVPAASAHSPSRSARSARTPLARRRRAGFGIRRRRSRSGRRERLAARHAHHRRRTPPRRPRGLDPPVRRNPRHPSRTRTHRQRRGGALRRLQVLVDGAPRVLRVGWSTVMDLGPHGAFRVVGSPGAPETHAGDDPWMPLAKATVLDGQATGYRSRGATWTPPSPPRRSAQRQGARAGPPRRARVPPSEVARLGYLAGIVATVLG